MTPSSDLTILSLCAATVHELKVLLNSKQLSSKQLAIYQKVVHSKPKIFCAQYPVGRDNQYLKKGGTNRKVS